MFLFIENIAHASCEGVRAGAALGLFLVSLFPLPTPPSPRARRARALRLCTSQVYDKIMVMLEAKMPVALGEWTDSEVQLIKDNFHIITTKPIVYLVNLSKKDFCRKKNKHLPKIAQWVAAHGGGTIIPLSVEFEAEYFDLKSGASRGIFVVFACVVSLSCPREEARDCALSHAGFALALSPSYPFVNFPLNSIFDSYFF